MAVPAVGAGDALRIKAGRVRLWALGLFGMGVVAIVGAPGNDWHDWGAFWSAGATSGGPDLVYAGRHVAWQAAHGVPQAAAWLFWPFAQLSVVASFWVQAALMVACIAVAGWIAARVYGLTPELAILAALAWAPSTASVVTGQNAPFALLLAMVAIWALATDRPWLAGLAVGVLWYKPTLALGFVALFVVRGRWRELGVAIAAGGAAFLLSVAAVPGLQRAGIVEAASAACLIGLAAGPRAWGYEAALAFPFMCWVIAGGVAEPWRTRLVVAAYLVGPLWLFSRLTQVSVAAAVVLTAAILWCWRWRWWGRRNAAAGGLGALG